MTTTEDKIKSLLNELTGFRQDAITPGTSLRADLGMDSLDHVEMIMAVEDRFNICIDDAQCESVATVQDIITLVDNIKAGR